MPKWWSFPQLPQLQSPSAALLHTQFFKHRNGYTATYCGQLYSDKAAWLFFHSYIIFCSINNTIIDITPPPPFRLFPIFHSCTATAKSLQSCPTLSDPIDGSPPGFSIPGILQARTLEWVAISFSNACKWKVKVKSLSRVQLLATPWTVAYQAPPSMGFSRQEYWSGLPLPLWCCN